MKVGVYTRFWETAGGGEVYAGTLAEVLAGDHDVELVCETEIDVHRLESRLGLRLAHLPRREIGDVDDAAFAAATETYDLFMNCSHGSQRPNGARFGVYVVHFPDFGPAPEIPAYARVLGRLLRHGGRIEWGRGFHHEESDGVRSWRWTGGCATFKVHVPAGRRVILGLDLSKEARPPGTEADVVVEVDGDGRWTIPAAEARGSLVMPMSGGGQPVTVTITTPTFSPRTTFGVDDPRELGVQLERLFLHRAGLAGVVTRRLPAAATEPKAHEFLGSYHAVVSNSPFTSKWIKRRWRRASTLIEPPVRLRSAGPKSHLILTVGRFFARGSGHSKHQLEMVRAFGALSQQVPGWELHIVGGCSDVDRPYLDLVREEVGGLPVSLHVNAPVDELDDLYERAAIYWHAAGLHEDVDQHPERMEHFGISVVEAMSAGVVPVVVAAGGPADIVRPGLDGLHFHTEAELVSQTIRLVREEELRSRMSASSRDRASEFGRDRFEAKVRALVADACRP
ncbi:MAG TPA: glycosyltransferase [Acidimicrobiales bacterium]|nr:glycosyltransferase [Acidimicrobiales bacterium]